MSFALNNNFVLGIYGDGQLARLLALEARKSGIKIVIYSLDVTNSPCQDVADSFIQAKGWNDYEAFQKFTESIDVLALENEFVPASFLFEAEETGIPCYPNAKSYDSIDDKLKQVTLAEKLGVQIPKSISLPIADSLTQAQTPVMLKALRGGYDGYGNFLFDNLEKSKAAFNFLEKAGPCLAQELIHFDKEVAVMVVRAPGQAAQAFPVVETIQENNICHCTLTPARLTEELLLKVQKNACHLIEGIDGIGIFGVEFFIRGNEVIFNEIAPRPHNSGHQSMEACNISQFEALVLLAAKRPVPNPSLKIPSAGMLNLLGTHSGPAHFNGQGFRSAPDGFLHLYGKKESRPGRKMGHYTLLGNNPDAILKELNELKTRYQI
ncbi:MAG TPA: ATP-grasp domain-containing protein [Bacteriovoracaceae bacterium]|nr:ATP-grasp domain-containing protein [Bacteriovoracaceae bacterium]